MTCELKLIFEGLFFLLHLRILLSSDSDYQKVKIPFGILISIFHALQYFKENDSVGNESETEGTYLCLHSFLF